jgi:hypothetical protein
VFAEARDAELDELTAETNYHRALAAAWEVKSGCDHGDHVFVLSLGLPRQDKTPSTFILAFGIILAVFSFLTAANLSSLSTRRFSSTPPRASWRRSRRRHPMMTRIRARGHDDDPMMTSLNRDDDDAKGVVICVLHYTLGH